MNGYMPGLFERLLQPEWSAMAPGAVGTRPMAALKDSVARDLEALLNTRAVMRNDLLPHYSQCARSVITYGLTDFAGLSLSSATDRDYVCLCIETAILRHEPRLHGAKATLEVAHGAINRLNFAITATLVLKSGEEDVSFDAVLQPSSLHYSISQGRKPGDGSA